MASRDRIVLLFCNGTSFHKGTWAPIVRRVQAAAALHGVPVEVQAIDWKYHGAKSSDADAATLYYEDGDKSKPRVEHPAKYWTDWAPVDLYKMTRLLRNEDKARGRTTHIVGIGHSMGATSLLKVEVAHPGTFAGLVLFEPSLRVVHKFDMESWATSLMVKRTLAGQEQWDSLDSAINYYKTSKAFRRWHPEGLEAFFDGGVKKTSDGKVRLSLPLLQEAAFYCFNVPDYTDEQLRGVKCRVVFEYGSKTQAFNVEDAKRLGEMFPDKFTLDEPLDGITHLTVMEDPALCASRVIRTLETLPVFQRLASNVSKL